MCVVSMVSDWYNDDWRKQQQVTPFVPFIPSPLPQIAPVKMPWDDEALRMLKDIMKLMKKLDDRLGLPDCEDPKKAEWIKSIEKKVKRKQRAK